MARRRSRGEGSSWKRSDGRWCADYRDPAGERRVVYGATEREARAKAATRRGRPLEAAHTLAEYLQRWLDWQDAEAAAGHLAANTLTHYRINAHNHIIPAIGRVPVRDLRADHVRQFIAVLRRKPGRGGRLMAATTVHRIFCTLRTALG